MIKTSAQEAYYKFAAEKDRTVKDYISGGLPGAGALAGAGVAGTAGGIMGTEAGEKLWNKMWGSRVFDNKAALKKARNKQRLALGLLGAGLGIAGGSTVGGLAGRGIQGLVE